MRNFLGQHNHPLNGAAQNSRVPIRMQGLVDYRYREHHFETPTRHQLDNVAAQTTQHRNPTELIHVDDDSTVLHILLHRRNLNTPAQHTQAHRQAPNPTSRPSRPHQPRLTCRRTPKNIVADMPKQRNRIPAIETNSDHNPNNPYLLPSLQIYSLDPPPTLYWCRETNGGYIQRTLDEIEHQLQPGYWAERTNK